MIPSTKYIKINLSVLEAKKPKYEWRATKRQQQKSITWLSPLAYLMGHHVMAPPLGGLANFNPFSTKNIQEGSV